MTISENMNYDDGFTSGTRAARSARPYISYQLLATEFSTRMVKLTQSQMISQTHATWVGHVLVA